jgi:hypothetical protein
MQSSCDGTILISPGFLWSCTQKLLSFKRKIKKKIPHERIRTGSKISADTPYLSFLLIERSLFLSLPGPPLRIVGLEGRRDTATVEGHPRNSPTARSLGACPRSSLEAGCQGLVC